MKHIYHFLDKYLLIILWLAVLISVFRGEIIDSCFIMLLIINENIEKIKKGK